jgi:hypothetical protein
MIPLAIFDDLRAQLVWPATNATPTAINLREPTSESVRQAAASLIRYFDFFSKKNSNACGDADAARWHTDHTFCGGDRIRDRDLKRRAAPSRGTQQGEGRHRRRRQRPETRRKPTRGSPRPGWISAPAGGRTGKRLRPPRTAGRASSVAGRQWRWRVVEGERTKRRW